MTWVKFEYLKFELFFQQTFPYDKAMWLMWLFFFLFRTNCRLNKLIKLEQYIDYYITNLSQVIGLCTDGSIMEWFIANDWYKQMGFEPYTRTSRPCIQIWSHS